MSLIFSCTDFVFLFLFLLGWEVEMLELYRLALSATELQIHAILSPEKVVQFVQKPLEVHLLLKAKVPRIFKFYFETNRR